MYLFNEKKKINEGEKGKNEQTHTIYNRELKKKNNCHFKCSASSVNN